MRIALFLSTILLFVLSFKTATAQNMEWAKKIGGLDSDLSHSMAVDRWGNVYTMGWFSNVVDFDPGVDTFYLTATGFNDIFISKTDANGNFVWAKQMEVGLAYEGNKLAVDSMGNVLTTGYFEGVVDFDPGAGVYNLTSAGGGDIFISKLDSGGNFVWAKRIGGPSNERVWAITTETHGNILLTGNFYGAVDFDPGAGVYNLTSIGNEVDAFVSKLDSAGNFVWAKMFGGEADCFSYSLAVDTSGNIYIGGTFKYTADFDPGPGIYNLTSAGEYDAFISKLDAAGNFVWAKRWGAEVHNDNLWDIGLDMWGNLYAYGSFSGTVDFDPGPSIYSLAPRASNSRLYVSKFDSAGNFIWVKNLAGSFAPGMYVDALGNSFTTGYYHQTPDFDPGPQVFSLTGIGGGDVFITKLDSGGNFIWAKSFGGTSDEIGYAIVADNMGTIYVSGYFTLTADFDPSVGTYNLVASGDKDVFVSKLSCKSTTVITQSACDSLVVNGQKYTISGTYTQKKINAAGCDSTITLNLTIKQPTYAVITQTGCDSIVVNGQKYTISGTYTQKKINAAGCDSTLTLNLTIKRSTTATITQTGCDSIVINGQKYAFSGTYKQKKMNAAGCDSTITLNLTIKRSTIATITRTGCDSIVINGQKYTAGGTYTQKKINAAGCDSTITLNLTIKQPTHATITQTGCESIVINGQKYTVSGTYTQVTTNKAGCDSTILLNLSIDKLDLNITRVGDSLIANMPDAVYQWINCKDNSELTGYTSRYFIAPFSGSFKVFITNRGCSDTSACHNVLKTGISVLNQEKKATIFPNPNNGHFNLEIKTNEPAYRVIITNITGQTIKESVIEKTTQSIDLDVCNGLYFVSVLNQSGVVIANEKFVVSKQD